MKPAFFNIPESKREIIINACIDEFAAHGYEKSSTDRIIKTAGISKGGLYEYIAAKEELFIFITEHTYRKLYDFIRTGLKNEGDVMPDDILERFRLVSSIAIDFYIKNPEYIHFIANTYRINDQALEDKIKKIFMKQFMNVFGTIRKDTLRYDRERLIDLLIWTLAKTRDDFLHAMKKNKNVKKLKAAYNDNWDFYLSVLKTGIYK
ncbi:MAG TPA: TetR/AcrR family transcriptional regulator [Spirochaetota bacterium]|jgi:AcrR family transcriptional regulator|nr:TetR/AcrR family transcriptional regulator [Spirochaetota bacterium]HPS88313.1 TetR/AcrR family transcriptional regulator [Spirochaetota bacterium]